MTEPQEHGSADDHSAADHDPEDCYECLLKGEVINTCRCAVCCRGLIIEVGLDDAEREPRIKEKGSPIITPAELTESGQPELEGYLLNGKDLACVFLDQKTNLCTIYETRPLTCRLFDCDGAGREQLIELGILDRVDTLPITLPPALRAWVEERVADGGFGSVSKYLRRLVREDQKRQEALLQEARARSYLREADLDRA
jgi:Fe-S-cluster containining protein